MGCASDGLRWPQIASEYSKGHIKELCSRPTQPNPPSHVPKQKDSTDYLDFEHIRTLTRSTTPSAPDSDTVFMDILELSGVPNLLETGALHLQ